MINLVSTHICKEIETKPKKKMFFSGYFNTKEKDFYIKKIIYNKTTTIVFWSDNTKTVSICEKGDVYTPETGLANCILKKLSSNTRLQSIFEEWIPPEVNGKTYKVVGLKDLRSNKN